MKGNDVKPESIRAGWSCLATGIVYRIGNWMELVSKSTKVTCHPIYIYVNIYIYCICIYVYIWLSSLQASYDSLEDPPSSHVFSPLRTSLQPPSYSRAPCSKAFCRKSAPPSWDHPQGGSGTRLIFQQDLQPKTSYHT